MNIEAVDAVLNDPKWAPYWGWHDDHRHNDRTSAYLPAMQQVRSEFSGLIDVLRERNLGKRCLQLGMGAQMASHEAWQIVFDRVVTIDEKLCAVDAGTFHGLNTHLASARAIAEQHAPFDLLFIDAGHELSDIDADFWDYQSLVRAGGIIAVHDACKRPGYEDEIAVWRWLQSFKGGLWTVIGEEVGIAWKTK